MNKHRKRAFDLEDRYEKARQEWNAAKSHEERLELGDIMNEIRRQQYDNAADDWTEEQDGFGGDMKSTSLPDED